MGTAIEMGMGLTRMFCAGVVVLLAGCGSATNGNDEASNAGQPETQAPVQTQRERPNVLMIMWDTVRADRMSLYGHDKPTTPRLDAFAKDAVVFEHATAPGMWTLPSHAAMFTGLYAQAHGAKATQEFRRLPKSHDTVAERLGASGYDTFAFTTNLIAGPLTNLTQGFETLYTTYPTRDGGKSKYTAKARHSTESKLIARDKSTEISPGFAGSAADKWGKSIFKDAAPVAHEALVDWLQARQDPAKPWFAYINMMEAHTPRIPSMAARKQVMDDALIELGLATDTSLFAETEYIVGKRDYSESELAAIAGVYDATLVDLDNATVDLLEDFAKRDWLDDTVVILVSDHGEALGEHRMFEHRWSVREQLLHVPLMVRYPPKLKPGRVDKRVSTVDVYATIMDAAGLPVDASTTTSRSLLDRSSYDERVYSELIDPFEMHMASIRRAYPELDMSPWLRTYDVVYEGPWKLIVPSEGPVEMFDVHADPAELRNLAEGGDPSRERLETAVRAWRSSQPTFQRGAADPEPAVAETEAEKRQLCMLGYADCDEDEERK